MCEEVAPERRGDTLGLSSVFLNMPWVIKCTMLCGGDTEGERYSGAYRDSPLLTLTFWSSGRMSRPFMPAGCVKEIVDALYMHFCIFLPF